MTAHQLARQLLAGKDGPVHFAYPYGDYWRTIAAPQVKQVEECRVIDSTSINMPRVVTPDDEMRAGDEYDINFRPVILIK
jgi:hypothetical protein